jgi:subtilase family serine protease
VPLCNLKVGSLRKARALALLGVGSCFALAGGSFAAERAVVGTTAPASQPVEFTIYLPLRDRAATDAYLTELHTPGSPAYHQWMTPAQFDAQFGQKASTLSAISNELAAHGLHVTQVHTHSLQVSGTIGGVQSAFGAKLANSHFANGQQALTALSGLKMTPNLAAAGGVVASFSGMIRLKSFSQQTAAADPKQNRYSPVGPYWFDDLKQAYSYPSYTSLNGKGTTIGVLMTPGYNPSDMKLYFSHEKLAVPNITTFNVLGGAPYNVNEAAETHIDIQHSGGMAPKASIILYNLPDLADDSILAGLTDIVEYNQADVINMSFGGAEALYTAAYNGGVDYTGVLGIYDDYFMEGDALGITFVAASGDWGAKSTPPVACFQSGGPVPCGAMQVGISTPASSPHVTAVGGTNLVTTYDQNNPADLNSAYVSENANFDALVGDIFYGTSATGAVWGSGGGISIYYKKPAYQSLVSQQYLPASAKKWRTIPDVSVEMGGCPYGDLYYDIYGVCPPDRSADVAALGGELLGFVGTSLSSPDFVGLLALKIQSEGGRLGNENYDIYALAAAQQTGSSNQVFRQDIPGNNGFYATAPGYNLVLGNGSVIGNDFVRGPKLPAAGIPQTATNP